MTIPSALWLYSLSVEPLSLNKDLITRVQRSIGGLTIPGRILCLTSRWSRIPA